jgi:hypothetical protein
MLHQVPTSDQGRDGQAAPQGLAQRGQVGCHTDELLRAGVYKLLAKGYVSIVTEDRHISALEEAAGLAARQLTAS